VTCVAVYSISNAVQVLCLNILGQVCGAGSNAVQRLRVRYFLVAGAGSLPSLGRALCASSALVTLDISSCKISAEDASKLADAMDGNTVLQSLRLAKNGVGDLGAAAIGAVMASMHLTQLDISHCCICHGGAQQLAASLSRAQVWKSRTRNDC
jgi:hypothetical protein